MRRWILALLTLVAPSCSPPRPQERPASGHPDGAVYTLTNSAAGNAVAVFARADDGTLTPDGTFPTGGLGTGANLGSQGAVILSENRNELFAVNAGSNSISYFKVKHDGLEWQATVPSNGAMPISLTLHDHVLYVLNAGGAPNITGFAVKGDGLTPLAGSTRPLGAGSGGPAQVCVLAERQGARRHGEGVEHDRHVRRRSTASPARRRTAAVGRPTPFGFDFDKRGNVLVSEAAGGASSYDVAKDGSISPISRRGGDAPGVRRAGSSRARTAATRTPRTPAAERSPASPSATTARLTLLDPSGISGNLGAGSHPLDEAVSQERPVPLRARRRIAPASARSGSPHDGSLTSLGAAGGLPAGAVGLAAD